jgi:hypothetical protein
MGVVERLAQLTAIMEYVCASILRCFKRSSLVWLIDRGGSAAILVIAMQEVGPVLNSGGVRNDLGVIRCHGQI